MRTVTNTVLAALLSLGSVAWAQPAPPPVGGGAGPGPGMMGGPGMAGGPGMRGGPGRGMGRMEGGPRDIMNPDVLESLAAEVGVDQAVLGKIKGLVYNANREAIDLRADIQRERLTLRQLLDDPQPDSKKVLKQVESVGAAETKIRKNRVQLILQVRELLTPEQRQKLQHLVAERGRRGGPAWFGPPTDD